MQLPDGVTHNDKIMANVAITNKPKNQMPKRLQSMQLISPSYVNSIILLSLWLAPSHP